MDSVEVGIHAGGHDQETSDRGANEEGSSVWRACYDLSLYFTIQYLYCTVSLKLLRLFTQQMGWLSNA